MSKCAFFPDQKKMLKRVYEAQLFPQSSGAPELKHRHVTYHGDCTLTLFKLLYATKNQKSLIKFSNAQESVSLPSTCFKGS